MSLPLSNARMGIYVDSQYASRCGGHGMRYDVLREFAMRDGAEVLRLNAYLAWDEIRGQEAAYRKGQDNFAATLRDFGYKVTRCLTRDVHDDFNQVARRANTELALALDVLRQSSNLERVLLVSGDPDLVEVVRELQDRGVAVEVIGFDDDDHALREEADLWVSGYLVPNLMPMGQDREDWGRAGGRVRGVCYNHSGKGYGFLRYIRESAPGLWITDSRHPDSPFETVFFHDSQLPSNVAFHELPSRDYVFEFELVESDRFEGDLQAVGLRVVTREERPPIRHRPAEAERETAAEDEEFDDEPQPEAGAEEDFEPRGVRRERPARR